MNEWFSFSRKLKLKFQIVFLPIFFLIWKYTISVICRYSLRNLLKLYSLESSFLGTTLDILKCSDIGILLIDIGLPAFSYTVRLFRKTHS